MRFLRPAAFLILMAALPATATAAVQTVTIHNQSDQTIVDLYADEYADRGVIELLGDDTLEPGETTTVDIAYDDDDNDCVGDLRAVFADGTSDEIDDANICDDQDYVFD